MRDTTSFISDKNGWINDKGTVVDQATADLREVVGGFIRDTDTQAGTAVGEGISLATETIVDNGVEGLSDGFGEGIRQSGVEGVDNGFGEG